MPHLNKPAQTILVTMRGESEVMGKKVRKDNIITLDWHMPVSMDPLLYAIAVGKRKFSHGIIMSSGAFAVNFMPLSRKDEVLFCGKNSGATTDKFEETGLTKEECEKIDCPMIGEACAALECEVTSSADAGDHTIFIGKVLFKHHKSDEERIFHIGKYEFSTVKNH